MHPGRVAWRLSTFVDKVADMSRYTEEMIEVAMQLERCRKEVELAEHQLAWQVADARAANLSWQRIGIALGISAQAAWTKYGLSYEQKMELSLQTRHRFTDQPLPLEELPLPVPGDIKKQRRRSKNN